MKSPGYVYESDRTKEKHGIADLRDPANPKLVCVVEGTEKDAELLVNRLNLQDEMIEALNQALDQLRTDYVASPLDGHDALIRKLEAVAAKAESRLLR